MHQKVVKLYFCDKEAALPPSAALIISDIQFEANAEHSSFPVEMLSSLQSPFPHGLTIPATPNTAELIHSHFPSVTHTCGHTFCSPNTQSNDRALTTCFHTNYNHNRHTGAVKAKLASRSDVEKEKLRGMKKVKPGLVAKKYPSVCCCPAG